MNDAAVRQIAQSDPTPNIAAAWGEIAAHARKQIELLVTSLRELDRYQEKLAERGLDVSVDLGPIGNAAAAARRDLEKQRDTAPFEMPSVS